MRQVFNRGAGFRLLLCAVGLTALQGSAFANLLTNGGFETGDFTGWVVGTASNPWRIGVAGSQGNVPFAGTNFALTGCVGAGCINGTTAQQNTLSQTLVTLIGQPYTLTYEFYTGNAGGNPVVANGAPNELEVLWNGAVASDDGPNGTLGQVVNTAASPYVSFTVNLAAATTTSTTITFLGRQDPGYQALDNVDVETSGVVVSSGAPEPAAFILVAGALPLLWVVRRRVRNPSLG